MKLGKYNVTVYPSAEAGRPAVYLNVFGKEGQAAHELLQSAGCDCTLVVIGGLNWQRDMVPWDAPSPFFAGGTLTGGAEEYLHTLTEQILPAAEERLPAPPSLRAIAGYSLGGLFALYAVFRSSAFSRFASVSGSLWFPGIVRFVQENLPKAELACACFSLGEKEAHTRNRVLFAVEGNTEQIADCFRARGTKTYFVRNPGGHTCDCAARTAADILRMLQ